MERLTPNIIVANWHTALVTTSLVSSIVKNASWQEAAAKAIKEINLHICSNYIANNTSTSSTISCTLICLYISCSTNCVRWTGSLCSSKFNCGSIMHEPTGFDWSRTTENTDDEKADNKYICATQALITCLRDEHSLLMAKLMAINGNFSVFWKAFHLNCVQLNWGGP